MQEGRAERSMEALRRLSALKVRVLRGGQEEIIDAHDLVPGDLVLLSADNAVAADPKTPLELRIQQFGRYLVGAAIGLFTTVIAFGLMRGLPFVEILMVAISQMVSMVPEGLPVAMTIALAVGMQRMAKRGAIVRRLAAVETLGSTSVICSDKTGTLTKNEMAVTDLWLPGRRQMETTGAGYSPEGKLLDAGNETTCDNDVSLRSLLEAVALWVEEIRKFFARRRARKAGTIS